MNAVAQPAASSFTSHLLASDKREWSITVDGISFVLVRSEPDTRPSFLVNPNKPIETVDTWTLLVVADNGERVQVDCETGMRMHIDPSDKRPSVEAHTAFRLDRLMKAARVYAEAHARLSVMLDKLMAEDDLRNASKKARALREAAAVALRFHRVLIGRNGCAFSIVAGDAVLIVVPNGWTELTYRVGDEAVYDSYNLSYTGTIMSISPKTITVQKSHSTRTTRMTHDKFVNYNDQPMSEVYARNAETSRFI